MSMICKTKREYLPLFLVLRLFNNKALDKSTCFTYNYSMKFERRRKPLPLPDLICIKIIVEEIENGFKSSKIWRKLFG